MSRSSGVNDVLEPFSGSSHVGVAPCQSDFDWTAGIFNAAESASASASASVSERPGPGNKKRSCLVCRQRKVRCDKLSPCANCRRAGIACVVPGSDRPPRWARRLHPKPVSLAAPAAKGPAVQALPVTGHGELVAETAKISIQGPTPAIHPLSPTVDMTAVMNRLMSLETLVRDLRSSTSTPPVSSVSAPALAPAPTLSLPHEAGLAVNEEDCGRLVLADDTASRSRYVSSGFWSRINDELAELDELRANRARHGPATGSSDSTLDGGDNIDSDGDNVDNVDFDNDDSGNRDNDDYYKPDNAKDNWQARQQHRPLPAPATLDEARRRPEDRHAFLFGHNLTPTLGNVSDYRPPPPQMVFLFRVFTANVNLLSQVVHRPTMQKTIDGLLEGPAAYERLKPADEALLFAIYYAAVAAMEEEDMNRLPSSKSALMRQFRLGLELSLARADFLNTSDLAVVQALAIFLALVRRHDSPRFVWMMSGLAIRMAQSLGLHRDGSHFSPSLTPFEVEIRRRVWWTLCAVDVRSSEDQGTELTIQPGSFDTRLPLNVNDADISPDMAETPTERQDLTDMTYALLGFETCKLTQRMMTLASGGGGLQASRQGADSSSKDRQLVEMQGRLLDEVYARLDSVYFRYSPDTDSLAYWTSMTMVRMVMAKLKLMLYLPALLGRSISGEGKDKDRDTDKDGNRDGDEDERARLLTSAVEVAEYNHAFHAERACRRWRWLFDTCTQWHAIAFLLIETGRRPWDPAVERAWAALHSPYLIPAGEPSGGVCRGENRSEKVSGRHQDPHVQRFWLPLRKLMARARRHRTAELQRLRADIKAARYLEITYDAAVADGRSHPLSNPAATVDFRQRWRRLVGLAKTGQAASLSALPPPPSFDVSAAAHPSVLQPVATAPDDDNELLFWPSAADRSSTPSLLDFNAGAGADMDLDIDFDWGSWFSSVATL